MLPLRALPDGQHAVASLIANQASFAVVDTDRPQPWRTLARPAKARLCPGHANAGVDVRSAGRRRVSAMAATSPLGYSRKYLVRRRTVGAYLLASQESRRRQAASISTPTLAPLLAGRRVCVVDDAVSTGRIAPGRVSTCSPRVGIDDCLRCAVAMKQTQSLAAAAVRLSSPALAGSVRAVFGLPAFLL